MHSAADEPWYREGLRFECTRCGNCCTGAPGFVWVSDEEIIELAKLLDEPVDTVRGVYTRPWLNGAPRDARKKPTATACFFGPGQGLRTVYSVRPRQCRTWPFWGELTVRDPQTWEETKKNCPGAGSGQLIPVDEIKRRIGVIKL